MCGAQALGRTGFRSRSLQAPEHRLISCGTQAQLPCGMGDLPGPGIKRVSPASAGGLPSSVPPGKSGISFFQSDGKPLQGSRRGGDAFGFRKAPAAVWGDGR